MQHTVHCLAFALALASPALAQDVETIEIQTNGARIDDAAGSVYLISFFVEGSGITSVTVVPPGGAPLPLVFDPGEGGFFGESTFFGNLAALRGQFPLGFYDFELNGGSTTITVDYPELEPPDFADLTAPLHGGLTGVSPTFSWTVCPACSLQSTLDVALEDLATETALFETSFFFPAANGSIDLTTGITAPPATVPVPPMALTPGEVYLLGLDLVRGMTTLNNFGGDDFEYSAFFRNDLDAVFTVDGTDDLCNGDGGDQAGCTDCPCANNAPPGTIGGCLNQTFSSARLVRSGSSAISAPDDVDLRFEMTGGNPNALAVLTSGNNLAPQNPANPCFGLGSGIESVVLDGLRCAVGSTLRHGGRPMDANGDVGTLTNGWGGEDGPPAGLAAMSGVVPGSTRYFQVFYRADDTLSCGTGQNTTQAVEVTFYP